MELTQNILKVTLFSVVTILSAFLFFYFLGIIADVWDMNMNGIEVINGYQMAIAYRFLQFFVSALLSIVMFKEWIMKLK